MPDILIVDDSATMRKIAARMLQAAGLSVREAENGQIALDACRGAMPDGILLDWNMPVMDGPSFLKALRALRGGLHPKVVFCTSESDMDKIIEVLGAGADEFIMKPYDGDILRSKLALVGLLSRGAGVMNALAPVADALRVLVVDDSLVIRGLITRHLRDVPGISVVGSASDGAKAVERVAKGGIDVVVLDIEMPTMDGLTALPLLLKIDPRLVIIMASTLTTRNADISLKALRLGASDYVPKPTTSSEIYSADDFRRDLIEKITSFGRRRQRLAARTSVAPAARTVRLRAPGTRRPQVLAVASSTGGPKALSAFFKTLPKDINLPILVTQHMPPTFTAMLAEHLSRDTGWRAQEAVAGDVLIPGRILIAPGDHHLLTVKEGDRIVTRLNQGEKENFCRPAADPMLRSLANIAGVSVLTVVLTGMGHDGLAGCETVVQGGGTVFAQDEDSSVVWGMPGAVALRGLCAAIATPEQLAEVAGRFIKTGRLS